MILLMGSSSFMRNRDPHRENVENILAICLPILTMQHIRESPSVSHAMRISAWNGKVLNNYSLTKHLGDFDRKHFNTVIIKRAITKDEVYSYMRRTSGSSMRVLID